MLTQQNYTDVAPDWDKDTILECCKPGDTSQPCTDCCYDTWETELNKVTPAYNAAVEQTTQLQNKYDLIVSRRDRYKTWLDELDKAETLAREICSQLKLIAMQSDKIWYNACEAEKAIEILFCMLRDIYMQIDEIKTMYDSLQNCITRNNDPALAKGQGILKYLDDFKAKLDATVKTRDDIIKSIVTAVKLATLIRNGISTRDCDDEDHPYKPCDQDTTPCASLGDAVYYGFKAIICEWYNEFACETPCSDSKGTPSQSGNKQAGGMAPQHDHNPDCELKPVFDFPICNNRFRSDVLSWVDADNATLATLLVDLNKSKAKQQSLLACKNSLDQAIKAVDPATRCK